MSSYSKRFDAKLSILPANVRAYVCTKIDLCKPDDVRVCDGGEAENQELLLLLEKSGAIKRLTAYKNSWIARTDPEDVARVESKTVICTEKQKDTIPTPAQGIQGALGKWISPVDLNNAIAERYPGCMKGRTMYVLPFSMGPVGGPISKIGIQLTDSAYVVVSMRVMTRMGKAVLDLLNKNDSFFVKALHTVGLPKPEMRPVTNGWPCNPPKTLIAHIPEKNEICSFGSGYGGNSLLGKKCFALRIGSTIGKREGWLAEHMLILGITTPTGSRHYIAAAFPSCCGKTNLAMLQPTLPGYTVTCVGDDIAWMKFDPVDGRLRAINPEAGFFGVAPGTTNITNPNAMQTLQRNTVFTNVAELSDGRFYWEGLEDTVDFKRVKVTDWKNNNWTPESGVKAAHPNSRFCTPASQCPIIDPAWEDPRGVPIDAIIFGGRRPEGVPLVYQATSWEHGVFLGATVRSETTAAAEHTGKKIMHDPFAMRPFFGYNFGRYMEHWLSFANNPSLKLPKIFHVNWFRKETRPNHAPGFLWPGFCENMRVLDWILKRLDGRVSYQDSAIGWLPNATDIDLTGLSPKPDMPELLKISKDFWTNEVADIRKYFSEQLPEDLPPKIAEQLQKLESRVSKI